MQTTGATRLVETLIEAGARYLFSLSGNQIMSVYDATIGRDIEIVHTRHEAAAVHMADAWGRLTGEPGVALLTAGPGHLNGISAMYVALMAESPLLMISGHAPERQLGRGAFQEVDQVGVARPVAKASWRIEEAGRIEAEVLRALHLAQSARPGPVHLSIPDDVLKDPLATGPRRTAAEENLTPLDDGEIEEALALLRTAERPLILAGPALVRPNPWSEVVQLGAAIGVAALPMESPRGVNDPGLHMAVNCLKQADRVLLLGRKLDFGLRFGEPPFFANDCSFIQVEPDETELRPIDRVVLQIAADPMRVVARMSELVGIGRPSGGKWKDRVEEARDAVPDDWTALRSSSEQPIHPLRICAEVQPYLNEGAIFVSDGGEFGQWAQAGLEAECRLINGPAGSIGSALPMALAAGLVHKDLPVFVFLGDGTFGFHAMEFDTALRYGIALVAIVGNDARWNAEHQIQLNSYGAERTIGCDLLPTRYDEMVQAMGGHAERVENPDDLAPAIERAVSSKRPACVDVVIEPAAAPSLLVGGSHP